MKKIFRIMLFVVVLTCCIISFASCNKVVKGSEARNHIKDFFAAIVEEDYDKAESLLHPERPADLENFFLSVEKEKNIDFQEGIEIKYYTGFSSSFYNSDIDGSRYETTMKTEVSGKTIEFTIEIVRNDEGYGIYNFNINS